MKTFVEFYFSGISCDGACEKEVLPQKNLLELGPIPENAIAYRFFDKEEDGSKVNYSAYHYIGEEFTLEKFKLCYPQLASDFDSSTKRIVRTVTGGFYPLTDNDVVVSY